MSDLRLTAALYVTVPTTYQPTYLRNPLPFKPCLLFFFLVFFHFLFFFGWHLATRHDAELPNPRQEKHVRRELDAKTPKQRASCNNNSEERARRPGDETRQDEKTRGKRGRGNNKASYKNTRRSCERYSKMPKQRDQWSTTAKSRERAENP